MFPFMYLVCFDSWPFYCNHFNVPCLDPIGWQNNNIQLNVYSEFNTGPIAYSVPAYIDSLHRGLSGHVNSSSVCHLCIFRLKLWGHFPFFKWILFLICPFNVFKVSTHMHYPSINHKYQFNLILHLKGIFVDLLISSRSIVL